ncbi:MAG: hypothetical protein M5R36_24700 [Deltaproteobacteria bacterium]|nr:hypothetical protein [Deltaproteobacteria bacterium]
MDEADAVDGGTNVYISMGTYDEDVSGVSASLFGGYDASDGWSRDIDANTTTINGQTEYGVELVGVNGTTVAIDGLTVNGADSVAGTSAGVFLEGNNVLVSRNVLTGGDDSTASVGLLVSGVAPTWLTVVDNVIDTGTGATTTAAGFYGFIAGPSSFINNEIGSQDSSTGATYGAVLAPFAGSFLFHGNTFTAGDAGVGNSIAVYHLQQQPHSLWFENNEVMGGESTTGGSVGIYSIAGGHWNVVNNYVASTDALTSSIGGAFAYGGSLFADGNDFIVDGTATGTAIAFYSALKSTSFVTNNFADGGDADDISVGFALVSEDGSAVVSNNTFLGGSGDKSYGVYAAFDYNSFPPSVQFINNAVDAGTGTTSAVNVSDWSDANLGAWFMYNNNFSGASPDCIVYTDFDTGCETDIADVDECDWFNCGVAMGNLDETPGFVNPGSGNFHLLGTSNLIDAGINPLTVLGLPGNDTLFIDYDGENRPAGGGWDIGFDEVP